jgi:RND family efflux transporter MFP subunit
MANPAMPLATVVQMERVKITVDAAETDLGQIKLGQSAEIKVRSYPDEIFTGKVAKISPVLDPMSRMASIEILVDNNSRRLKPGMFAQAKIQTGLLTGVIAVPRYATLENNTLQRIDGKDEVMTEYLVYVIDGDKAQMRKLELSYINHVQMAVAKGLQVGERLVIAGQGNLRDGYGVTIKEGKEAAL